jgi:hypothetical protein
MFSKAARPQPLKNSGSGGGGSSGSGKLIPKTEASSKALQTERKGTAGFKEGAAWAKLQSVDSPEMKRKIGVIKKEAFGGGEMRTDGKDLYRFDRAHMSRKIHLEKYVKTGKGWQPYAECDPETLKEIPGSVEKIAKQKRKPIK